MNAIVATPTAIIIRALVDKIKNDIAMIDDDTFEEGYIEKVIDNFSIWSAIEMLDGEIDFNNWSAAIKDRLV